MEQTITQNQLITPKQEANILLWEQEEAYLLARHFQKLHEGENSKKSPLSKKSYFTRVNYFKMSDEDLERFNGLSDIKTIRIYLSLEEENVAAYTFCPIIYIKSGKNTEYENWFNLEAGYQQPITPLIPGAVNGGGTVVPGVFKEMILANWNSIENNLIDDLFAARDAITNTLVRVNFFDVSSDLVLHLFNDSLLGDIKQFILYPGVDMNKFQHRDMISFTPVLGVVPGDNKKTGIISSHGVAEFTDNEVFIEYLTPCPPTCPEE